MSHDKATPRPGDRSLSWGHGGSGAPDGDEWVWENAPADSETGVTEWDGRLFHAPSRVAEQVVEEHNAFARLRLTGDEVDELEEAYRTHDALKAQNAELLRVLRIVENYAHFPGQNFSWDDVRAAVFDAVRKAGGK
jgi:hypothetical protein